MWVVNRPEDFKQRVLSDPVAGINGDCFRCCVAALLNIQPGLVPHFYEAAHSDDDGSWDVEGVVDQWIDQFLNSYGVVRFRTVIVGIKEPAGAMEVAAAWTPTNQPAILSGRTGRHSNHAMLIRNGAMLFDPHPSNVGLDRPFENGTYIVEWLAKPLFGDKWDNV